jgi:hypothetical protein
VATDHPVCSLTLTPLQTTCDSWASIISASRARCRLSNSARSGWDFGLAALARQGADPQFVTLASSHGCCERGEGIVDLATRAGFEEVHLLPHRAGSLLHLPRDGFGTLGIAGIDEHTALRKPITGIAGCCAPPLNGHAVAAPPSAASNSRRPAPPARGA